MRNTNKLIRDGGFNGFLFGYTKKLLDGKTNILTDPCWLSGNDDETTLV